MHLINQKFITKSWTDSNKLCFHSCTYLFLFEFFRLRNVWDGWTGSTSIGICSRGLACGRFGFGPTLLLWWNGVGSLQTMKNTMLHTMIETKHYLEWPNGWEGFRYRVSCFLYESSELFQNDYAWHVDNIYQDLSSFFVGVKRHNSCLDTRSLNA